MISSIITLKVKTNIKNQVSSKITNMSENYISCLGSASISMNPNTVSININVKSSSELASDALNANNITSKNINTDLLSLGIKANNIKTLSFSVYQLYKTVYNSVDNVYNSVPNGFQVDNTIQIISSDLSLVGKIIDAAVKSGATITNVIYGLTEDLLKTTKLNLITNAIDSCKSQFSKALNNISCKIVEYLQIILNPNDNYNSPSTTLFSKEVSTPNLNPGEITVNENVKLIARFDKK